MSVTYWQVALLLHLLCLVEASAFAVAKSMVGAANTAIIVDRVQAASRRGPVVLLVARTTASCALDGALGAGIAIATG